MWKLRFILYCGHLAEECKMTLTQGNFNFPSKSLPADTRTNSSSCWHLTGTCRMLMLHCYTAAATAAAKNRMVLFVQSTEKGCHTVVGVSHSVNSKCGEKARPSRFQWWIKRRNPTLWIRHGVFQSSMMVQDLESRHSKVRQNAQPKFKILNHATLKDAMSNPKCRISTFAHYWKRQDLAFWPHFVSAVWHTYNRMTTFFCTLDKDGHLVRV